MGRIETRFAGNTVCFAITADEERANGAPAVHSLHVYKFAPDQAPQEIWGFSFPDDRTIRVDSRSCLAYGAAPAGATTAPAPQLQPGQIYGVGMGGSTGRPDDSTQGYLGQFCLAPTSAGGVEVKKVLRQHGETRCAP